MIKAIIHIFAPVLAFTFLHAQPVTLELGEMEVCPGYEVLVPINVTGFNDIGAFTLFIGYDTTVMTYIEHLNENPETQGIYSNAMVVPDFQVGLSWSSFNAANILSGKLVDLKFQYKGGSNELTFEDGCELVNSLLEIVEIETTNGAIVQSNPIILEDPASIEIEEYEDALFTINVSEATSYQWQKSTDSGNAWNDLQNNQQFSGVFSNALQINAVPFLLNGNYFRCLVCFSDCCIFSEPAILNVNPSTGSNTDAETPDEYFILGPNPFCNGFTIKFNESINGKCKVILIDQMGVPHLINESEIVNGDGAIACSAQNLKRGLYMCKLVLENKTGIFVYMKKVLKMRDN